MGGLVRALPHGGGAAGRRRDAGAAGGSGPAGRGV